MHHGHVPRTIHVFLVTSLLVQVTPTAAAATGTAGILAGIIAAAAVVIILGLSVNHDHIWLLLLSRRGGGSRGSRRQLPQVLLQQHLRRWRLRPGLHSTKIRYDTYYFFRLSRYLGWINGPKCSHSTRLTSPPN